MLIVHLAIGELRDLRISSGLFELRGGTSSATPLIVNTTPKACLYLRNFPLLWFFRTKGTLSDYTNRAVVGDATWRENAAQLKGRDTAFGAGATLPVWTPIKQGRPVLASAVRLTA